MNREILFRGKRVDNGEWVEGGYAKHDGKVFIVTWIRYNPDTRDWDIANYYEDNPHYNSLLIEVVPETVCQYTGLADKSGRNIFEGDIVKTSQYGVDDGKGHNFAGFDKFFVVFFEGSFCLENKWRRFNFRSSRENEIIGNIYDNPELLEGGEEE